MVNSIRDRLNEADTISEIKLTLNHNKNIVCVVVEGENDEKLFRPLLSGNVELFQSYSGNTGVDIIVSNYFKGHLRVIGIRDKDYLSAPINNQCFFCDFCCAEMMVISIDACFEKLYYNFYTRGAMDIDEVRLHCLERLEKLSKLRMLNYLKNWKVLFDGIKPSKCYNSRIDEMDNAIVCDLNAMNPANMIDETRNEECDHLPKCTSIQDYLMITNGHDFINVFCKVSTNRHSKVAINSIETTLRSSFGIEDFKKTTLYHNLNTYQEINGYSILR